MVSLRFFLTRKHGFCVSNKSPSEYWGCWAKKEGGKRRAKSGLEDWLREPTYSDNLGRQLLQAVRDLLRLVARQDLAPEREVESTHLALLPPHFLFTQNVRSFATLYQTQARDNSRDWN